MRAEVPRIAPARVRAALLAVVAGAALLALPSAAAGAADVPAERAFFRDGPAHRHLMNGTWYHRADPSDTGYRSGFHRFLTLSGWAETTIPHAANAGDLSNASYLGSVHWYRKDFIAPEAPPGARWRLRFESVNHRATVWLNGRRIGRHTGAYLPFELDATRLRRTRVNRLVVKVDSRRGPFDVPTLAVRRDGRFTGGWWNYTGILREVYLRPVETFDFTDVLVRPYLRCRRCDATIKLRATVRNVGRRDAVATIEGLVDDERIELGSGIVRARRSKRFTTVVKLDRPRLWSLNDPYLYRVRLRARDDDDEVVAGHTVHTGVRSLKVSRTGRFLLNGRPVTLRGASMHEDDPAVGAALRPANIRANFELLRELGANMTRAHYPLHPLTLELADRHGVLVWSEIPVYQMQDGLFQVSSVRVQSVRILREMVRRDRNHPSVVVWSVGNENTSRPGPGFQRYVREAKRTAKHLDPTRLVGLAFPGYPTIERQPLYAELDALGVNDYFGWYPGPGDSLSRREDLEPYLDRLHGDYPRQALFVTEFGAEANRPGPADEKGTYDFQRDFLAYHLDVFARKPFVNGALVWILRDFRVKPGYDGGNPRPQPPFNTKGLVDDAGLRKPAFDRVRELFGASSVPPQE